MTDKILEQGLLPIPGIDGPTEDDDLCQDEDEPLFGYDIGDIPEGINDAVDDFNFLYGRKDT